MSLKANELKTLLAFVASVTPDNLSCDGCYRNVPQLAESQLGDIPLSGILEEVQNHLRNCPCCAEEYELFVKALTAADQC